MKNQYGEQDLNSFMVSRSSRFFIPDCLKLSVVSFALPCDYTQLYLRVIICFLDIVAVCSNTLWSTRLPSSLIRSRLSKRRVYAFVGFLITAMLTYVNLKFSISRILFFYVCTEILLNHNMHLQRMVHCMLQRCPI